MAEKHYARRRHAMVAAGTWLYPQDVAAVRAHIERLIRANMPIPQIAAEARVAASTIRRIRNRPGRYVEGDVADRILAVQPTGTTPGALTLPALGYQRRILALFADGHPVRSVRDAVGLTQAAFWKVYTGKQATILAATAARIREVYDRLGGTDGGDAAARKVAARYGGSPAITWDDETIDHPLGRPRRGSNRHVAVDYDEAAVDRALTGDTPATLTTADRREVIRRAWLAGEDDHLIANRLRMTVDAVRRQRHAHGYTRAADLAEAS